MKKKILFLVGSTISVAAPIATTVSCSNSSTSIDSDHKVDPNAIVYDISNVGGEMFVNQLLGSFNVKMPSPVYNITPTSDANLAIVKQYLDEANFHKDKIKLINNNSTYLMDFSEVHHWMNELASVAQLPFITINQMQQYSYGIGIAATNVQAIDYTKIILKSGDVTSLSNFLNMYNPDNILTRPATKQDVDNWIATNIGDPVVDINHIAATHPYVNLLKSYHSVFYKFIQSDFYKEWLNTGQQKTFLVSKNDSPITMAGLHAEAGKLYPAQPGTMYDLPNSLLLDNSNPAKPTYTTETSNLEFSFFYSLLNLK